MKIPQINFGKSMKHLERLITDNSPTILTALGVVGVGSTAVLSWRAANKSTEVIFQENIQRGTKDGADAVYLTKAEEFARTWKFYIAPVVSGVLSAACIIGANRISAKRAAAIAGVLAMTQDNFKEYKDKVAEKLTGPKQKQLEAEIAQEKTNRVFDKEPPMFIPDGEQLCIDSYSMRQFPCTRERIQRAENNLNRRIIREDSVSLSDFYDEIGLQHTAISDDVGWNTTAPLELELTATLTKEGRAAMVINYAEPPLHRPWSSGTFR